jgi:hypothetical protein
MLPAVQASPHQGTAGFFRAELTEAIRGSDDPDSVAILGPVADRSTVSERVRHWVRLGLLSAIGERYPGVGRHRSFALDAILPATILNYLADERIQIREGTRHALDPAAEAYGDWKAHFGEGVCYWMRLGSPRGEHVAPTYWYKNTQPIATRMTALAGSGRDKPIDDL